MIRILFFFSVSLLILLSPSLAGATSLSGDTTAISEAYESAMMRGLNSFIKKTEEKNISEKEKLALYYWYKKQLDAQIEGEVGLWRAPITKKVRTKLIALIKKKGRLILQKDNSKTPPKEKVVSTNSKKSISTKNTEPDIDLDIIKKNISEQNTPVLPKRLGYCHVTNFRKGEKKVKLSNSVYDMDNVPHLNTCADKCRTVIGSNDGYICTIDGDGTKETSNFTTNINVLFEKIVQGGNRVTPISGIVNKEMHVIGVYNGIGYQRKGLEVTPGKVTVKISKNIGVLVLSSYERNIWNLEIADGVTVERIITNGYYNQKVSGNKNVPITEISIENGNSYNDNSDDPRTDSLGVIVGTKPECTTIKMKKYEELTPDMLAKGPPYDRKIIGEEDYTSCSKDYFPKAQSVLKRLTGLDVTSFQGANTGEYFEIK